MDVDLLASSGQPAEYKGKRHGEEFGNGWEGGDFATVEQLVGFIQNPTVRPMEDNFEEESSSPHKNQVRLSNLHSKTSSGSSFSLKLVPNDPVSSLDSEMEELKGGKGIYEDTLPTMVPQHGQAQGKQHFTGEVRKTVLASKTSRKCPKCNKIFPWASSLRRHIMTHTGLKPFMCGQCAMQFTTRSNLLRHVHRRHGMEPTANNDDYIITLTPSQQKVLAEEFRKEDKVEDVIIKQEPEEKVVEEPIVSAESPSTPDTPVADKTPVIPIVDPRSDPPPLNKRYACGLCGVPFANRSNLVRHLQRLHETTKDHPNFKEMLLKLGTSRQSESEFDSSVNEQNGKSSDAKVLKLSSPNSGETKEFQCAICMIGFTKRNNAARHLQQQHAVSKHGANYCELIIHSKPPPPPPSDDTHLKTANHENNVNNEVKLENSQPTQPITGTTNKTSASKKQTIKEEAVVENEVPKWKGRKRSASRKRLEGEESGEFTILMSSPAKRKVAILT
uniref:C2H2-type domain-containing protein n=1 Tax=Ciona savignyi TaxID=51511 RepID=H2Z6F3_CIOSA